MSIEVVCCVALGDAQVYNHLMPIARNPLISKIWIIRHRKSDTGQIPKAEYILVSDRCKPLRWLQMRKHCFRLARNSNVKAFISFNPIPYGLIAASAAKRYNKQMHYGFIGSDWYRDIKSVFWRWLIPRIKKGSFFTVTGNDMRKELIENGFETSKIAMLPHSIDLQNYSVSNPDNAQYDCVFVGKLIHLKRVDIILRAFNKVLATHPEIKLCIVGDGPLMGRLKQLMYELKIDHAVNFVGYANDVKPYFANARIVVMASLREGFPFALVEGICSGLVPVSTPVGTITEHIIDRVNGLLFPCGDTDAMAGCITQLIDDKGFYEQLREKALLLRNEFSYEEASVVWNKWLTELG